MILAEDVFEFLDFGSGASEELSEMILVGSESIDLDGIGAPRMGMRERLVEVCELGLCLADLFFELVEVVGFEAVVA